MTQIIVDTSIVELAMKYVLASDDPALVSYYCNRIMEARENMQRTLLIWLLQDIDKWLEQEHDCLLESSVKKLRESLDSKLKEYV
jgi:hypothetical protein